MAIRILVEEEVIAENEYCARAPGHVGGACAMCFGINVKCSTLARPWETQWSL